VASLLEHRLQAQGNGMIRAGCVWGIGFVLFLAAASFADAHTDRIADGSDVKGALDIRSAEVGHRGEYVEHTITTFDPWPLKLINANRSPLNYLAVGFNLKGDGNFDRYLIFLHVEGRLRAFWVTAKGYILTRFPAARPNARSVSARVPSYLLENGGGYEWAALTVLTRRGHRKIDFAPNKVRVLHDLLAPKISLGTLYDISTFATASTTVPVDFTLSDHAESAGVDWSLQRRVLGTSVWQVADSGEGVGPQTAHLVGEDGANYALRLVARDRQDNTTTRTWGLSFPIDDSSSLFGGAYTGSWSTTPIGDPFLGTLHSTSTPGDSFTYTFNVTHRYTRMMWIGPGSPNGGGTATITFDGYPPFGVDQSLGSPDRARIWEATDPAIGSHTITITNVSGTIAIDGLLIR
jgi:hypothetical protein